MELTPELLRNVTFKEQWRGVSPSQVDEFLERVAIAVGQLQERLRRAEDRAAQAESRLAAAREEDDELRRTLLLAQRTATAAVEEARAEAASIVAAAESRASEATVAAEARISRLEAEMAERHDRELGSLADRRRALQADIDALTAFVEAERRRLRGELERQIEVLDATLAVAPAPPLAEVDVSPPAPAADSTLAEVRRELADALRRAEETDDEADAPAPGHDTAIEVEDDDDFLRVLQRAVEGDVEERFEGFGEQSEVVADPAPQDGGAPNRRGGFFGRRGS